MADDRKPHFLHSDGLLPQALERRALNRADNWSYTFLDSKGAEASRWTAVDLLARARAVARRLEQETVAGEPVLLVCDPGPDLLAGFLGCLWSGRPAVPINPPRSHPSRERLLAVMNDCGAGVAFSFGTVPRAPKTWSGSEPNRMSWILIDDLPDQPSLQPASMRAEDLAFIQYTSGSTACPRGVRITHGNLTDNLSAMAEIWSLGSGSRLVSWLPAFHDFGLIFGMLLPFYAGASLVQMAPNSFVQRPRLWLSSITKYRATHTAAPSSAYDLCCRRIRPATRRGLDLSSLEVAVNAAEPIDPAGLDRFEKEFGPWGFRRNAFAPAYGLAEATLAVTATPLHRGPIIRTFDRDALGEGRLLPNTGSKAGTRLLTSGVALPGITLAIVDPETRRRCPPDHVGEIWIAGPSVGSGYWKERKKPGRFGARIAGEERPGRFLRTGDLGALIEGELVVTGRIKDLITIDGITHYPQDIERVAQEAHGALRPNHGAAFNGADQEQDVLVLVQELERVRRGDDPDPILRAIAHAVTQVLRVPLTHIVLTGPGAVRRTSSGKVQRLKTREAWLSGDLHAVAAWRNPEPENFRDVEHETERVAS